MHILGKIFVWTLVLAAGASAALMSRQLQIRNSYSEKLEDLRSTVLKNEDEIAAKEAEIARLESEYDQLMVGWNQSWDNREAAARKDATGLPTLGINAGTNVGVGAEVNDPKTNTKVRKNVELHVFRTGNNASTYVGRFKLDPTKPGTIRPDGVAAYRDWNVREIDWQLMGAEQSRRFPQLKAMLDNLVKLRLDLRNRKTQWRIARELGKDAAEINKLKTAVTSTEMQIATLESQAADMGWNLMDGLGPVLRIWATLPGAKSEIFSNLYFRLEELDRKASSAEGELIESQKALAVATAKVEDLERKIAGQNGTGGFVKELRDAEDARNAVLGKVDDQRRTVKKLVDQRNALLKQNQAIVNGLKN